MRFLEGLTSKGGHYSPGVIAGGMLYVSGQLPIDPAIAKHSDEGTIYDVEGADLTGILDRL